MTTTFVSLKDYYERPFAIDDADGNVVEIPLRIKRFTLAEMQAEQAHRYRLEHPDEDRFIVRRQDGDEQETVPVTVGQITMPRPKVSDDEVRRRRLAEMGEAESAAYHQAREAHEAFVLAFAERVVRAYIRVAPACRLQIEDGGMARAVQTGDDLVRVFGGNKTLLLGMAQAVLEENFASPAEKKASRSRSSSSTGSTPPAGAGPTPETTAPSAARKASAGSARAPGRRARPRSGSRRP